MSLTSINVMRKFHILSKNLRTPNEVQGNNRLTAVIEYTLLIVALIELNNKKK